MCWFVRRVAFDECVSIGFPTNLSPSGGGCHELSSTCAPNSRSPVFKVTCEARDALGMKENRFSLQPKKFSDSANCQQERTRSALLETLYEELHVNSQSMMGLGGDDDKMENGGGGGGGGGFFESFKVSDVPPLDVAAALMLCMYDDWRSCPDACLSCFVFCLFVCF